MELKKMKRLTTIVAIAMSTIGIDTVNAQDHQKTKKNPWTLVYDGSLTKNEKGEVILLYIQAFKTSAVSSNFSWYERQMFNTFGINPFVCPKCNIKMKVSEFYHYLYPPTRIYI